MAHGFDHAQAGSHGPLRVIFMRQGVAKVDEQAIAEILGDMPLKTGDDLGAGVLIGTHHLAQVFRVELAGEHGRIHQVTEQHGELQTFRIRRRRGDWGGLTLHRRDGRRGRQRHWRGGQRCYGRLTCPNEDAPVFVHGQTFGVEEFIIEGLQVFVIQPVSAGECVQHSTAVQLAGAPELNRRMVSQSVGSVGPAGMLLADDTEMYERNQRGVAMLRPEWLDLRRGLHRERTDERGLKVGTATDETGMRGFWAHYLALMEAA